MQHSPQLTHRSQGSSSPKDNSKKYAQKATEAIRYLQELFTDAVDYNPGQAKDVDGIVTLEVKTSLGTKFTVSITFSRNKLQLKAGNFPSGIAQMEYAKIKHFLEDLECYLNVAHQW